MKIAVGALLAAPRARHGVPYEGRREVGSFRFVDNLNGVDAGIIHHRNKPQHELTLCVWRESAESLFQGPVFPARLLENIKVPEERNAVTVYVKHTAAGSASAGVVQDKIGFGKLQGKPRSLEVLNLMSMSQVF
ncbi:MAG: hypothetical protein ACRD18_05750 [Terriglobia bacterium]